MKLSARNNTVVTGGQIGEDSNFSIDVNAKMFRVLSDTMYQDKIGSMVRELSCNAVDAHVEAGRADVPFTIHLPDSLEPWFSVKDEGIGLSDENLREMYTTYGRSTKDQSDDVIGAFGLGSKTPFAYTDQFTVTSIFEGVQRIYTALIGEDGMPVLKLQGESETTEHAGLEINVSVRDSDYSSFKSAVTEQLKFFKVKPVLTNNRNEVEFKDIDSEDDIIIEKDGIRVYKGGYNSPISGIWVVQGGVGYPLSIGNLGNMDNATSNFANAIREKGAILDFPIGEIEVTASREGISYTDNVIARIIKRLGSVAEIVCRDALVDLKNAPNLWDRVVIFNDLLDVVQKAIRQNDAFEKLFAGTSKDRTGKLSIDADKLATLGYKAVYIRKHKGQSRGTYSTFERPKRFTVSAKRDGYLFSDGCSLYPHGEITIIARDTNSKPMARIKHFVIENDYPNTLVIEPSSYIQGEAGSKKELHKIAMALGMSNAKDIKLLSEMPAPVVIRNGKSTSADRRPRGWFMPTGDRHISLHSSREWEATYDDLDDIGQAIYIGMDRHDIQWGDHGHEVMSAVKAGAIDMPVIAVNQQTLKRIQDGKIGEQLTSVEDAYKLVEDAKAWVFPMIQAVYRYKAFMSGFGTDENLIKNLLSVGALRSVQGVADRIGQLELRVGDWWFMRTKALDAGDEAARDAGKEAGEARRAAIMDKYPMLRHVNRHDSTDEFVSTLADYMKMVDERG